MDWSKFTKQEGAQLRAVPCLDVVAFSSDAATEARPGFERFMRAFTDRYSGQFTYYQTGDMKRFRKFEPQVLDAPSHWFSDQSLLATKLLGFHAHSGRKQTMICPPSVDFTLMGLWEPPSFVFRVSLPVEVGEEADGLPALVQEALADFPLQSGYCGYSLLWERTDHSVERDVCKWAGPLLRRHPGLNYGDVIMASNAVHDGVVVVSWLTFLGETITNDLGGREALEKACPPDVALLPLDAGGCLLRAGSAPALGDVNTNDRLPAQHAVGKLVAARRASDEAFTHFAVEGMDEDTAYDWKRRFFG